MDGASGVRRATSYDAVTGQVLTEQTWGGASSFGSAPDKTSTTHAYYSNSEFNPGRLKSSTKDGQVTSFTYTPRGELAATWGATYPVKYEYDVAGRLWKMQTYRTEPGTNPATWPAGDPTEWVYHAGTTLLQRKKDANGSGALLLYDAAGRLQKRTWVRNVSATYTYNLADELLGIDYSDTTPDVTFTHNNDGRLATISDGAGSRVLSYDGGRLTAEIRADGRGLLYDYDGAGRKLGYSAWTPAGWLTWGGWGYEPATGRMSGVSTPAGWVSYGYSAGSSTVGTTTFGSTVSTRTPDALGRVKTIETNVGGVLPSPLFKHTYVYDSQGRRIRATHGNGNYWEYSYNSRNEVTYGGKKWSTHTLVDGFNDSYNFDTIGNRTFSTHNGVSNANWVANSRNQITNKNYVTSYYPSITVTGEANTAAVVKVNGVTAARNGSFFSRNIQGSSSLGTWAAISIEEKVGTNPPTVSNGAAWLEQTQQTFVYDLDGNLTQDGRWTYTWDGENRLIKMETRTSGVPSNLPKDKLVFRYDSQGRRIEKEFWRKDGAGTYQLQYQSYFTYEGWNLIAEEIASPASANVRELRRSFYWGLDLSGTLQGAGGVGGLLMMNDHASGGMDAIHLGGSTTSYLYAYDGNGNVMGLLNVSDPQAPRVEAEYEYQAFGKALRGTGAIKVVNPFRFSTKYHDNETGLLYYGYRFYAPSEGRWLSRDPIEEAGGINMYGLVGNGPVNSIDYLGMADVTAKLTRLSADYFGVYGEITFDMKNLKLLGCCGRPPVFKTIEPPIGKYQKIGDMKVKDYPLQTSSSSESDALRSSTLTRPAAVLGAVNIPPRPTSVSEEDYNKALNSSVFIGQGSVAIHAGMWGGHSRLCILVGTSYVTIRVENDEPFPGLEVNKIYEVPGFERADTLRSQIQLNLWFVCLEKALKRGASMDFRRTGDPTAPTGNLPKPLQ